MDGAGGKQMDGTDGTMETWMGLMEQWKQMDGTDGTMAMSRVLQL